MAALQPPTDDEVRRILEASRAELVPNVEFIADGKPIGSTSPPQDLSPRVIELARFIDRLPPGTHLLTIVKPEVRAVAWEVSIDTVQHNRTMKLPKSPAP